MLFKAAPVEDQLKSADGDGHKRSTGTRKRARDSV
jgi:hypothetical protein